MKCINCGQNNYDWVTTCGKCGQPVTAQTDNEVNGMSSKSEGALANFCKLIIASLYGKIRKIVLQL